MTFAASFPLRAARAGAVACAAVFAVPAAANPKPLPFSYVHEQLAAGDSEVEQYVDLVPLRPLSATTGGRQVYLASQFQTEFEHGLTDHLELGLYVTFAPTDPSVLVGSGITEGNGAKQRLRWRMADTGAWPIDVALYGEVVENQREVELEGKVILQRRFGKLRAVANLWGEVELEYENRRDFVLNPTLGATYEVSPLFHAGVESWLRAEFSDSAPSPRPFDLGPHVYVGPTALFNFGRLWWSTGVYVRASDFGRAPEATDTFGPLWVRTIVGVGL